MKRYAFPIALPVFMVIFTTLSPGCQKNIPIFKELAKNANTVCKACKIMQITIYTPFETSLDSVVYSFTYNALGNPVTIRNTSVGTGSPNSVFKYDKRERLIEVVQPYENDGFFSWIKYGYNNRDQIVVDTMYLLGVYEDSIPTPLPYTGVSVRHYTYDAYNRVATRTDSVYGPGTQVFGPFFNTYQYDDNGDLIRPLVVYDDRVSLLRTNKIWMFFCNDYSVHNSFIASSYNPFGLPLTYQGGGMPNILGFGGNCVVKYSCDPGVPFSR